MICSLKSMKQNIRRPRRVCKKDRGEPLAFFDFLAKVITGIKFKDGIEVIKIDPATA